MPYEDVEEKMDSFNDAWELICSYCKTKITDVAYNTWISRIKPLNLDFESNTAYLIVPNDFHRQTIKRCYIPLLNEAFEAIFDNKFNIALKTRTRLISARLLRRLSARKQMQTMSTPSIPLS